MVNVEKSGDEEDGVGRHLLFSRDEGIIAVTGLYIPQCEWEIEEGKHYRALQCRHGTKECFCVDKFGRRLSLKHTINKGDVADCASTRGRTGTGQTANKEKAVDEEAGVLEIGREGIRRQEQAPQQCEDPLREFKFCGSSCPISCSTIREPRCQSDQCVRGCFCRLPYVILDGSNPFGSRHDSATIYALTKV